MFISKATPGDDDFVLWLAPKLEAAGYSIFADILTLNPGDRWRKQVTGTLQERAAKMLLCCRDSTLKRNGVQEEIGIAEDLVRELNDPRFIIPLRVEPFRKLFGIGELQYVDFVGSWASGLRDLLNSLDKQMDPKSGGTSNINPNWEAYKKRLAIDVEDKPELLTSNWLRVLDTPCKLRYYVPSGALNHTLMASAVRNSQYPVEIYHRGFFSFSAPEEVKVDFGHVGKFAVHSEYTVFDLLDHGDASLRLHPREANNILISIFRKAWENVCRQRHLYEYAFSKHSAFHVTKEQLPLGKRISWGESNLRRNSMLRNIARGRVWQFGVSAMPSFWPFLHFKLKSRVLFSEIVNKEAGAVYSDPVQQHRMRRSICSGWRNKAWHGRLMAFLQLLSSNSDHIDLPMSRSTSLRLDSSPVRFSSPVTTVQVDTMDDDTEESDISTLGSYMAEGEGQ